MRRVCKHTTKRNKKSVDNDHIYSLCFVLFLSLFLFRNFHFAFSALFRCIFCLFGEYEPIECTCIFTRRWTGTFRTAMLYWSIWFGFVCMRMDYYHCAFEAHSQHFDEVENLFVPSHWWNRKCACSQNREHFSVVFSAAFCLILLPIFCDKMWLILPNQPNRLFLFFHYWMESQRSSYYKLVVDFESHKSCDLFLCSWICIDIGGQWKTKSICIIDTKLVKQMEVTKET